MSYGNPTGFVAFDQYLAANQEGAEDMARKAGQAATNAATPMDQQRNVNMLGSANGDGTQAMLQKGMGKGKQVTAFDAALAGGAGEDYFQRLQQQYGTAGSEDLARRVSDANAVRARKNAPGPDPVGANDLRDQETARQAGFKAQADAMRAEDSKRPKGQMGRERWANLHGMTLEDWIARGQNPAF